MGITKLLYGDCMEWLPKLPEGQTSLILADMPYNITDAEYDKNIIPLPELWQEYKRILQPGGIVALFASQPFTTKLINSNPAWFKYCWYWDKICSTGALFAKVQPMRRIEEIVIFQKPIDWLVIPEVKEIQDYLYQGKERAGLTAPKLQKLFNSYMSRHYFTESQWALIPQGDYEKLQSAAPEIFTRPYSKIKAVYEAARQRYKLDNGTASMRYFPQGMYKLDTPIQNGVKQTEIYKKNTKASYLQEFSGYPSNVIQLASQTEETANNKRVHPSQKPVALLEYIIKTYTKPGELVVDNTMGSGSTGVAAINTGRGFIGIELDGVYYNAAVKRIKEAKQKKKQEAAECGDDEKPAAKSVTELDTPQKEITLGSLFDGLGGWQLAAIHNGVKPLWSSEIEAFPMAITKKHFPDTLQLGDITKLDGATLPPVDIICAGSPCFVAGTSIQTKDGIKPIENIVVGDMVIADDCGWHKVVEIMRNQTESVYTIKAQGLLELEATGNHPFLVKHMKRYYPRKENGKRCNLRKFSKAEWVKVEDLQKGDFVGYPILQTSKNTMSITKEEAWLIGRYIADGYVKNSQRKDRPLGQKSHNVVYCIGKGKLDNFKSKIKKYHVCYKKAETATKGEIINERLMQLCMLCGKGAEHKEIPGIFLDLPRELLQELISGYISGNGSKTGNLYRATTISKKLALSLQAAIHKAYRIPAKVYYDERPKKTTIQGREVNQKDTYTVTWLDNIPKQSQAIVEDGYIWQPIREIKRKEQKTIVYNFEVADVHSYTANGIMVHNCQDLSVAGKRKGLEGERSGLFRKAIDIVHGMREATKGQYPKFFIWENVPGAFSSNKGADFQAVLEEISKSKIPMPNCGRWAEAGMVRNGRCDIAWRVLDAQFWGVPQRRKRIFLIADFREKQSRNTAILFEPESVPGNTTPGGNEGQGVAERVKGNIDETSRVVGTDLYNTNTTENQGGIAIGEVYTIAGNTIDRQIQNGGNGKGFLKDKSYTLNTIDRHAVTEPICIGNGQMCQLYQQEKVGALNCMHEQQAIITAKEIKA